MPQSLTDGFCMYAVQHIAVSRLRLDYPDLDKRSASRELQRLSL
jgi:hypothetical protein